MPLPTAEPRGAEGAVLFEAVLFEAVLLPAGGTSQAQVAGDGGALGKASGAAPGAALALPCTDSAVLLTESVLFSACASHTFTFHHVP